MKTYNVLGLVISFILAFVCYFATSNIFVGIGVLLVAVLCFFVLIYKKLVIYKNTVKRIHECYLFINNFLVTLSIKESLTAAFDACRTSISDEFYEYLSSIEELNPQEKLLYLNKYFPFHIYQIFVDVVLLWLDEGGKILEMSEHIVNEMRQIEEYITYCQSVNRRKAIEIATLWFFSLTIVIVLRLSLNNTYGEILKQPIFVIAIAALALMVLFTTYLLTVKVTTLDIRRNQNA